MWGTDKVAGNANAPLRFKTVCTQNILKGTYMLAHASIIMELLSLHYYPSHKPEKMHLTHVRKSDLRMTPQRKQKIIFMR